MAKIIQIKTHKAYQESGRFSTIKEYYKFIPQSNGKGINAQDREVFDLLAEFTKNGEVAKLDYTWLKDRFGKCQKTIRLILKKLSPLFECNLVRFCSQKGVAQFCKLHIKRTANFDKIIDAALSQLSEKNSLLPGKEFPEVRKEISVSYNKNKKEIKENSSSNKTHARAQKEAELASSITSVAQEQKLEKRDEIFPFASSSKEKNSSNEEKKTREELEFTDIAPIAEAEIIRNYENDFEDAEFVSLEQKDDADNNAPSEKKEENLRLTGEREKELEFNHHLSKSLSLATFMLLSKHFTFAYDKDQNKLLVSHSLPLSILSDAEKEVIRTSAAVTYGEGVKLAVRKSEQEKTKLGTRYREVKNSLSQKAEAPESWKQVLYMLEKTLGTALVASWFGSLVVTLSLEGQLLVSGSSFMVNHVDTYYKKELEQALLALGLVCELSCISNGELITYRLPSVQYKLKEGDFCLSQIFKQIGIKPMEEKMKQIS